MTEIVTSTKSGLPNITPTVAPSRTGKSEIARTPVVTDTVTSETDPAIGNIDLREQVAETVKLFNNMAKARDLSVEFSVDETLDRQVVKIIDKDTGDVYMQLPSEAALHAARNLDALRGIFLDDLV